jgi:hypothetical protein
MHKKNTMSKTVLFSIISFGLIFLASSCKTYYIPIESFKQQFAGLDSSKYKEVITRGPVGDKVKYKTFPISFIKCVDKAGNPFELKNAPSLEIRFTDSNNKRTIFYFDRISVDSTSVTGVQSRFISSIKKKIALDNIVKIEIQDGGKKFKYID